MQDGQVGTTRGGVQARTRAAPSQSSPLGHLVAADSLLFSAVEVGVVPVPCLLGGLDPGVEQRMDGRRVADRQRAADAVELVGAARVVLRLLEEGQDIRVAPPL